MTTRNGERFNATDRDHTLPGALTWLWLWQGYCP
jgi:hypothetical protein